MGKLLSGVIIWALSSFVTKLFAAFGLAVGTYAAISTAVDALLEQLVPTLGQLPATVLSLLSLAGVGQALTIIASAIATRSAFLAAKAFISVIK
ncbi:DUF2523 family protein [Suttonella ornithocola]|uniref:Protein of uncharacterized function (DUF2523) n=1 Tax=Suttonella ornithocola TaxID=279832 RepID=A0A380MXS1_9GAMM|nr:DUF2523 family protein [Suttonella ornithocola]SUO97359.1 Protein of uncharacterised function (DUF2523) [Suttonella ornithocola]